MRLQNKVALVTGASAGIGEASLRRFAAEGATVALNYKSNDAAATAVVKAITEVGGKAKAFKGDVSKVAEIERITSAVIGEFGRIDIVVNNAGVFRTVPVMRPPRRSGTSADLSPRRVFHGEDLRHFRSNGGGGHQHSSIAGVGAFPNCPALRRRAARRQPDRALAAELGKEQINVN